MLIVCRCPIHNKPLYGNGQTSTHNLFKCPDCDYTGEGPGAVRHDLPERYNKLETALKEIKAIEDDWDNAIPECAVCYAVQEIAEKALKG